MREIGQVLPDDRHERGVDDRGTRSRVFEHLREDLVRDTDERLGIFLFDDLANARLVLAVQVSVDERDGDRIDATLSKQLDGAPYVVLLEGSHDVSGVVDPLFYFEAITPLYVRRGYVRVRVPDVFFRAVADLVDIAKALGGNEARPWEVALDEGVRADGRSVREEIEIGGIDVGFPQSVHHPSSRVVRRRGCLAHADAPGVLIEDDYVSKRPTDINASSYHDKVSRIYTRTPSTNKL
jgi:hypothetical protein